MSFHPAWQRPVRPTTLALALLAALTSARPALAELPRVGAAIAARWNAIEYDLDRLRTEPLGLVPLLQLEQHTRWVPYPSLVDVLEPVVAAPDTHPLVRAAAAHRLARAHLAAGRVDESQAVIAAEGYVTAWSLIGPFPNDSMAGFETAYGPELARQPEGRYPGRVGEVGWRDVSDLTRLGYLDVGRLAPPGVSSVSYAATRLEIEAGAAGPAHLWTSVDGAYKVWLNGELVAAHDADLGGASVREWWPVRLRRGANALIVKVAGAEASPGFYLRLTDTAGVPLEGWSASAAFDADATALPASAEPAPTPAGSVADTLLSGVETTLLASDEAHIGAALILHQHYPRDAAEPWRRYVEDGGGCTSGSAAALLLCPGVVEHFWEQQRALTLAVAALDPEADASRWRWASYALAELAYGAMGEGSYEEARQRCEAILATDPDFVPARLLLARVQEAERQIWRAYEGFIAALGMAPDSPETIYQAQWSYQQVGTTPEVIDLYRRALDGRWDVPSAATTLARALAQAGELDEALDVLDRELATQPLTLGVYWLKADLLLSAGNVDAAAATLRETTERFQGSAPAWETLGRLLLTEDYRDEAADAFAQALAIEPQDSALAQYRQALLTDESTFYAEYRLDSDALQALAVPEALAAGRDYTIVAQQQLSRVYPNGLSAQYVQEAYRVQTRRGAEQLRQYAITFTPDDETVEILTARIVKPDGTVLESFDRWEESLSQPWYGLYYDYRALVLGFDSLAPGDLLEIEYTLANVSQRNMFDDYYGSFFFVQDGQPKAFVRAGVLTPDDMTLHVRAPSLPHEVTERDTPDGHWTLFELHDVPNLEVEAGMPGRSSVADHLHISTFATWGQVAAWYWNLIEDQLVTSPEIERTVDELVEGLTTTEERVRAIHEYVVRNTRYVGLEFGIHGYRPYRTTVIFSRRFGDCKDTASLIKVMLGLAGIEANLVLLRTRDLGNIEELPPSLSVFNHAIAYVPELDLFLDGTAGYNGVAELPYLDQGASILIVEDGGGHTFGVLPYLPPASNRLVHAYEVDLGAEGAPAQAQLLAQGQFAPPMRLRYEAEENRLEEFQRDFTGEFPGAIVADLGFVGLDDINTPVEVSFTFAGGNWLQGSADRPTLRPLGTTTDIGRRLAGSATRRQPLMLDFPFETRYRVDYRLPPGMVLAEEVPSEQQMSTPFGTFRMHYEVGPGTLGVEAELILTATQVSVAEYPDFRAFLQTVEEAINRNLTLVRGTDG